MRYLRSEDRDKLLQRVRWSVRARSFLIIAKKEEQKPVSSNFSCLTFL